MILLGAPLNEVLTTASSGLQNPAFAYEKGQLVKILEAAWNRGKFLERRFWIANGV
jgi:hypothetical protein